MTSWNKLLEWASEVSSGTWRQWRAVCDHLRLEPTQAARHLSALGHVEFDWSGDQFACAPPVAVLIPRSSGSVLVTGARRSGLRLVIETVCAAEDAPYDVYFHDPVPQPEGPDTWLVELDLDDADAFCRQVHLVFQVDSGRLIAEMMPTLSLANAGEEDRPDPRYPRSWLDPVSLNFRKDEPASGDGLWWVEEYRRHTAFVRSRGVWYRVPVREYGPYLAYPSSVFLRYDPVRWELHVHDRAPLPPLLARAATLQSGRLPLRVAGWRRYVNIDQHLATLIAERLQAKLEVTNDAGRGRGQASR